MNMQTDINPDHNQDHRFKNYDQILDRISADVFKAHDHTKSKNDLIHTSLGRLLDLGYTFIKKRKQNDDKDWLLLKSYFEFHNERWSSKCEASIFHGLVSIAFNQVDPDTGKDITPASEHSRYRAILRYAHEAGMSSKKLIQELSDKTIKDVYADALSILRFDPVDNYIEDEDERFERASKHFENLRSLPKGKFTSDLKKPTSETGFVSAILKLTDEGFEVIGCEDNEPQKQIKAKVTKLVPAEARHARQKLKDKAFYELYVMCDLYKRFLPKVTDIRDWNMAHKKALLPELKEGVTQEEFDEYQRAVINHGKSDDAHKDQLRKDIESGKTKNKFKLLHALDFKIANNDLVATTRTTHPNTPCWEFTIPLKALNADLIWAHPEADPLMAKDINISRFTSSYLSHADWAFSKTEHGYGLTSPNEKAETLLIEDYSSIENWRSLAPGLKSTQSFQLDKFTLDQLSRWREDFKATPSYMRRKFDRILSLKARGNQLNLVFPSASGEIRSLGKLQTRDPNFTIQKQRYFDFSNIENLILLAQDYGIDFHLDLLTSHQGETALKFHCNGLAIQAAITIPLLISVKGNPTEITKS